MVRYEVFFTLRPGSLFSPNAVGAKTFRSGDATLSISGEELSVIFEQLQDDDRSATEHAHRFADRLCDAFAAASGQYAYWEQNDYKKWVGDRELIGSELPITGWVTSYKTSRVAGDLDKAGAALGLDNEILAKFCAYLRHGVFLWQQGWRTEGLDLRSFNSQLLATEIILNFNKAVTTIVGDRANWRERGQIAGRQRALGLQQGAISHIKELRNLRNDADVAHHSLDPARLERLQAKRQFALNTAKEVIEIFVSHLKCGGDLSPWAVTHGPSAGKRVRRICGMLRSVAVGLGKGVLRKVWRVSRRRRF